VKDSKAAACLLLLKMLLIKTAAKKKKTEDTKYHTFVHAYIGQILTKFQTSFFVINYAGNSY